MTPFDSARFAVAIANVAIAARIELDDPTIEVYWRALEDVPIELVERAARELEKTATFFPRPAEWRAAVDGLLDKAERATLPTGGQMLLPGDVGTAAAGEYRCPACDNTGWSTTESHCEKPACHPGTRIPRNAPGPHLHRAVSRCADAYCASRRKRVAEMKRRYGKRD